MGRTLSLAPAAIPTLDELAANPERAIGLSSGERAQLVTRCAAVLAALSGSMATTDVAECAAIGRETPEPDRLLTVQEAAHFMGFATSYVYEMCRRGDLPAVRRKKYVRIRYAAAAAWIQEHEYRGIDKGLSTMLTTISDRRGSAAAAPASRAYPEGAERQTRRPPHNRVPLGNRRGKHPGTNRALAVTPGQDREDTTP